MDLNINKYYIKEIKYRVNSKKTAIFKLRNFNIVDIEIIEENNDDDENVFNVRKSKDLNLDLENEKQIDSTTPTIEKSTKIGYTALPHFSNEKMIRTKELIDKTKDVPYKVYEKIGNLDYNLNTGEFNFVRESDPYVVNDEREMPKQKKPSQMKESQDEEFGLKYSAAQTENKEKCLNNFNALYLDLKRWYKKDDLKNVVKQLQNAIKQMDFEEKAEKTLENNLNHLKMQNHFELEKMKEDEEKEKDKKAKSISMFDTINLKKKE